MPKALELVGSRFDKLLVLELIESTPSGRIWLCLCDCGKKVLKVTSRLRNVVNHGTKIGCKSCEPLTRSEVKIKHGGCRFGKSRLYKIWKGMRSRCSNPNSNVWIYYGGKGIKVCEQWQDFSKFREWALTNKYSDDLTIDRINPNENYKPENCEWVTGSENSKRMMAFRRNN